MGQASEDERRERPKPDLARTQETLKTQGMTWAPIVAALAIDLADFFTAGPIGLAAGVLIGGASTLAICVSSGVPRGRAALLAIAGGIYCAVPFTEVIPLATVLTALSQGLRMRKASKPEALPETSSES